MNPQDRPDGEPDAGDEELLDPPQPGRRGVWWVLAALVAGLTVWALVRSSAPPSRPLARPSSPAATSTAPVPTSPSRVGPPSTARMPVEPGCRAPTRCSVRSGVPAAIARLVRTHLPPGAHVRVRTFVAAGSSAREKSVVARYIDAHVDSVTVLIRVQRGGSGRQEIVPDPLGVGSLLLHRTNSGYVVRLQYLAPDTVPPVLGRLRALIRDPRLTAG